MSFLLNLFSILNHFIFSVLSKDSRCVISLDHESTALINCATQVSSLFACYYRTSRFSCFSGYQKKIKLCIVLVFPEQLLLFLDIMFEIIHYVWEVPVLPVTVNWCMSHYWSSQSLIAEAEHVCDFVTAELLWFSNHKWIAACQSAANN